MVESSVRILVQFFRVYYVRTGNLEVLHIHTNVICARKNTSSGVPRSEAKLFLQSETSWPGNN